MKRRKNYVNYGPCQFAVAEPISKWIPKRPALINSLVSFSMAMSIILVGVASPGLVSKAEAQLGQIGQVGNNLPSIRYYNTFLQFYNGRFSDAGRDFVRGSSSAYRVGEKRFVDSVCYWTMAGECFYHLGNYADALKYYEQALDLYVSQTREGWQSRVTLPPNITARQNPFQQSRINWGTPQRQGDIAQIPRTMTMLFGRLDAGRAYTEGGLVDTPEQRGVDVKEIMRCAALAIHRRHTILGSTAKHSVFTANLVTGLASSRGRGPLFQAWNRVLLGLAQASMEDWQVAKRTLSSSLQFSGMDHNLTPVALTSLCRIAFATADYSSAEQLALEASYSAGIHNQYDLVEESLHMGAVLHLMNKNSIYPPLQPAIQWANRERARLLHASLLERMAACAVEANDVDTAEEALRQVRTPMRSNGLSNAVINSRLRFVTSQLYFLKGDFERGSSELNEAIEDFQLGSRWLFQLGLADQNAMSGDISPRKADQLYSSLLRDPTDIEWRIEPFECIAYLMTPHVSAMERWFETKLLNKQYDKAVEIAEMVRRHRFFANLPLGGRLLAFRWILEGPAEALTPKMQKQRARFLEKNPEYKALSDRAKEIRIELLKLPLQPAPESAELKQQTKLFVELSKVAKSQENFIASYAVRRQPADMAFPPQGDLSSFFNQLRPHQAAYVNLQTRSGLHSFLVANNRHQYLGTDRSNKIRSSFGKLFKTMGIKDFGSGVEVDALQDESWKSDAHQLAKELFIDGSEFGWGQFTELVVVPDGITWYIPFEMLQIAKPEPAVPAAGALDPAKQNQDPNDANDPDAKKAKPKKKKSSRGKKTVDPDTLEMLGDKVHIRYVPTLFLAYGNQRPVRTLARTAVMSGRIHPKGEVEVTQEAVKKIQADLSGVATFESKMKIPTNYYGAIIDRMVVCSDIKLPQRGGPFAISPAELDRSLNEGSNLASWLSFPFWGPEHVVLPGFTSQGAAGTRKKGDGQDLFLTSCGLMASGSRSIMISRWRVGGENSLELTRQYAKNLTNMSPIKALKSSVEESKQLDIDYEKEPRIKFKKTDPKIKAEHPFFWAGHMVIEVPNELTHVNPAIAPENIADPDAAKDPNALPDPNLPDKPADAAGDLMKEAEAEKQDDGMQDDGKLGEEEEDEKQEAEEGKQKSGDGDPDKESESKGG